VSGDGVGQSAGLLDARQAVAHRPDPAGDPEQAKGAMPERQQVRHQVAHALHAVERHRVRIRYRYCRIDLGLVCGCVSIVTINQYLSQDPSGTIPFVEHQ